MDLTRSHRRDTERCERTSEWSNHHYGRNDWLDFQVVRVTLRVTWNRDGNSFAGPCELCLPEERVLLEAVTRGLHANASRPAR